MLVNRDPDFKFTMTAWHGRLDIHYNNFLEVSSLVLIMILYFRFKGVYVPANVSFLEVLLTTRTKPGSRVVRAV